MTTLSEKALLVTLSMGGWSARKLDKRETAEVQRRNNAVEGSARVNKDLLPLSSTLEDIQKITGEIRQYVYKMTLPWTNDGIRMIPGTSYMEFVQHLRGKFNDRDKLIDKFVAEYPSLQHEAQLLLGNLYNVGDYPDVSDIRGRFYADVSFMPVPKFGDFRVEASDEEMKRLERDITERAVAAERLAIKDCWERLHKVVKNAVDSLSDPKRKLFESTFENARELCQLLPRLNISDDPNLESIRFELEQSLVGLNKDMVKHAPDLRADVAKKMSDIQAKMGAFYG